MTTAPRPLPFHAPRPARVVALLALVTLSGCYRDKPSPFAKVQQETRRNAPAVSKAAVPGSSFNKLFPKPEGDYDVVYTQEKDGYSQASLVRKGEDVATLAISDTLNNPEAADKYKNTQETFEDCPIVEIGNMGTGLLVGGRYQIQIRSKDANFSKFEREDWLKKFDLKNLAKLQ